MSKVRKRTAAATPHDRREITRVEYGGMLKSRGIVAVKNEFVVVIAHGLREALLIVHTWNAERSFVVPNAGQYGQISGGLVVGANNRILFLASIDDDEDDGDDDDDDDDDDFGRQTRILSLDVCGLLALPLDHVAVSLTPLEIAVDASRCVAVSAAQAAYVLPTSFVDAMFKFTLSSVDTLGSSLFVLNNNTAFVSGANHSLLRVAAGAPLATKITFADVADYGCCILAKASDELLVVAHGRGLVLLNANGDVLSRIALDAQLTYGVPAIAVVGNDVFVGCDAATVGQGGLLHLRVTRSDSVPNELPWIDASALPRVGNGAASPAHSHFVVRDDTSPYMVFRWLQPPLRDSNSVSAIGVVGRRVFAACSLAVAWKALDSDAVGDAERTTSNLQRDASTLLAADGAQLSDDLRSELQTYVAGTARCCAVVRLATDDVVEQSETN